MVLREQQFLFFLMRNTKDLVLNSVLVNRGFFSPSVNSPAGPTWPLRLCRSEPVVQLVVSSELTDAIRTCGCWRRAVETDCPHLVEVRVSARSAGWGTEGETGNPSQIAASNPY